MSHGVIYYFYKKEGNIMAQFVKTAIIFFIMLGIMIYICGSLGIKLNLLALYFFLLAVVSVAYVLVYKSRRKKK